MSDMKIGKVVWAQNVIEASEWHWRYMVNKFGKPVDRTEWEMHPQTYNAYYNPSNNEIVVPGCNIIVPGYERVLADDAILLVHGEVAYSGPVSELGAVHERLVGVDEP